MNAIPGIDQPAEQSLSSKPASRRTFLKGVGLASAAGLAAPYLAGTSASAATTGTLIYGINDDDYQAFKADNPTGFVYSYRAYNDTVWEQPGDVPTTWPNDNPTHYVTFSVKPDLSLLTQKTFDQQIKNLLASAPDHAQLTMWHEAAEPPHNGPTDSYSVYPWMNKANLYAGHAYMQNLCATYPNRNGNHVGYGQIFIGPANQEQVGEWIAPNLDWYGVDIYDGSQFWNDPKDPSKGLDESAIDTRMTNNKQVLDGKATGYTFHITETNSVDPNHREHWALYLSKWMSNNGGYRFQWRYHCGGQDSGCYTAQNGQPGLDPQTRDYIAKTIIPTYGKPTRAL